MVVDAGEAVLGESENEHRGLLDYPDFSDAPHSDPTGGHRI